MQPRSLAFYRSLITCEVKGPKEKRVLQFFYFLFSFLIVSCAQPDWSATASLFASSVGYALFWNGMLMMSSKKRRFFYALIWFALIEVCHLNWFFADRYVGFYIYPVVFLVVCALGGQFGLISLLIRNPEKMRLRDFLAISGIWSLLEWSRLFVLSGFSWDPVGLALSSTLVGLQFVSLIGVYGLSFWIILTNLLALRLFRLPTWRGVVLWSLIACLPYLFGVAQLMMHARSMRQDPTEPLATLLVQTALAPESKISIQNSPSLSPQAQWERILAMIAPYQQSHPDLIVFSEAVLPYGTDYPLYPINEVLYSLENFLGANGFEPTEAVEKVGNSFWAQAISNAFHSDIIIGLEDVDFRSKPVKAYNAAFLFQPFSFLRQRYEKRILVPMGEYIPFAWCKKILSKYGIMDSYTPGDGATIFFANKAPIGVSICYEETYGDLMRQSKQAGAQVFVNLTNDVWYPHSRLPLIHYYHGRMRAVENGIPLLRACNTGVTCAVDSLGRVLGMLTYECKNQTCPPDVLSTYLPLYHYSTLYSLFGDKIVVYSSSMFFLWFSISALIKRKRLVLSKLSFSLLRKN